MILQAARTISKLKWLNKPHMSTNRPDKSSSYWGGDYLVLSQIKTVLSHLYNVTRKIYFIPYVRPLWSSILCKHLQVIVVSCGGCGDRSTLPGHVLAVSDILLWLQRRRWWWQNCGGLEVRPTRGGRSLGLCEKVCIKFPFPLIVWRAGLAPHALILKGPRNLCKGCHSHLSAPLNYSPRFWS